MDKVETPGDKQADESKAKAEMAKQLTTEEKVALRRKVCCKVV